MTSHDSPSVLVVHAPGPFCDGLVRSLEKTGYAVAVVGTVPAGLEAFELGPVSAVIAQEELGARTGSWMLEWMAVLRPDTVTLLLTTKAVAPADRKIDDVVHLPVPPPAVVSRLARALRDRGRKQARQPTPTPTPIDREDVWDAAAIPRAVATDDPVEI